LEYLVGFWAIFSLVIIKNEGGKQLWLLGREADLDQE
jgi:hypothetical protein